MMRGRGGYGCVCVCVCADSVQCSKPKMHLLLPHVVSGKCWNTDVKTTKSKRDKSCQITAALCLWWCLFVWNVSSNIHFSWKSNDGCGTYFSQLHHIFTLILNSLKNKIKSQQPVQYTRNHTEQLLMFKWSRIKTEKEKQATNKKKNVKCHRSESKRNLKIHK